MIDRLADLPSVQRVTIALVLAVLGMFCVGVAVGVVAAMLEKGWPRREWVVLIPLVAGPVGAFALSAAYRLVAPPRQASGYERRYWRAFLLIVGLGMAIGAASGILFWKNGESLDQLFGMAALPPSAAIFGAVAFAIACIAAIVLYHRAIDDHEERAYLWGSQISYYFLLIAYPAWWLLQRGGIVAPLEIGSAFILLLVSIVIQAVIWAWLKFR